MPSWDTVGWIVLTIGSMALCAGGLLEAFGVFMMASYQLRKRLGHMHPLTVHSYGVGVFFVGLLFIGLGLAMVNS